MDRRGGGIALVTQRKYKIIGELETKDYNNFEHDIGNLQIGPRVYTIIRIYNFVPKCQDILILGDFNIHINDPEDQDAQILQDTLNAFNLTFSLLA